MKGKNFDIWMLKNSWIQENAFIFCLVLKKNCNLSKLRYVVIASINKVVVPCYNNIVEWKSIWIELIIIGEIKRLISIKEEIIVQLLTMLSERWLSWFAMFAMIWSLKKMNWIGLFVRADITKI